MAPPIREIQKKMMIFIENDDRKKQASECKPD